MPDLGFELSEISRLIKLVEQRGLSELIVEESDRRIVIRGVGYRRDRQTVVSVPQTDAATQSAGHVEAVVHEDVPKPETRIPVVSPMVGVFYRSAGPDTAPFVEVGDRVEVGYAVGLIEAMKVFSEVPSEHAGRVAEIVAENGQLVRPNEPLLYLLPD